MAPTNLQNPPSPQVPVLPELPAETCFAAETPRTAQTPDDDLSTAARVPGQQSPCRGRDQTRQAELVKTTWHLTNSSVSGSAVLCASALIRGHRVVRQRLDVRIPSPQNPVLEVVGSGEQFGAAFKLFTERLSVQLGTRCFLEES